MQAEHDYDHVKTEFDCAVCGHEALVARTDGPVDCPDCEETYSLVLRIGFGLVKTNGWTIRVAVAPRGDRLPGTASG